MAHRRRNNRDSGHPLSRGNDEESYAPDRRGRTNYRSTPYGRGGRADSEWTNDKFDSRSSKKLEGGSTVLVSNLAGDVTEEDIKEIFGNVGSIKSVSLNYSSDGRSKGSAEIEFARSSEAATAVEEFDQAEVDGKPMYCKLVGNLVQGPRTVVKKFREPAPAYNNYEDRRGGRGRQQRAPQQRRETRDCHNCSKTGHIARDCRSKPKAKASEGRKAPAKQQRKQQPKKKKPARKPREKRPAATAESLDADMDAYFASKGGNAEAPAAEAAAPAADATASEE